MVVWNDTIIDGHHRWAIIQKHPEIPYTIKEIEFVDEWDALAWMLERQIGQRNMTDEQMSYSIGKLYEAKKKTRGGDRKSKVQIDTLISKGFDNTAQEVASSSGVAEATVKRDGHFSKAVDTLSADDPDVKPVILSGKTGIPKSHIVEAAKLPEKERKKAVEEIKAGTFKPSTPPKPRKEIDLAESISRPAVSSRPSTPFRKPLPLFSLLLPLNAAPAPRCILPPGGVGRHARTRLRCRVLGFHGQTVEDVFGDETVFSQLVGKAKFRKIRINGLPPDVLYAVLLLSEPQPTRHVLQPEIRCQRPRKSPF